jgi:N-acetylglucosaminyldiphosphoundecaprenol N-acetyl-beta-D-mannosaminyltransferase
MRTVTLFNYPFIANATIEELVTEIVAGSSDKRQLVVTPNAYILQLFSKPKYNHLMLFAQKADFILPDGIPIVWLSKLKNKKQRIAHRITGSDLFPVLWGKIKSLGIPATIVAPNNCIADAFLADYPGKCTTLVPDFFSEDDDQYIDLIAREILKEMMDLGTKFLFIGISDPKQTLICKKVNDILSEQSQTIFFTTALLGASFEFYFGKAKRAPYWVQKYGIEWLYRFAKEPRRLWKRYTIDNLRFLMLAFKEL